MPLKLSRVTRSFSRLLLAVSGCVVFSSVDSVLCSSPTLAADTIVFRYGLFEQTLPIADLRKYGETKQVSSHLQSFLRYLNPQQQKMLRETLQVKMALDIVALDKLLNTENLKQVLFGLSRGIARRDQAGVQALRSAVILGAKSKEGLGIISFLEAYPSDKLVIDLPVSMEILRRSNLYSTPSKERPQDNLSSTPIWQLQLQYQILATSGKQYSGCLFGDSVSAEVGNTLGEGTFNFALNGQSTISLLEQLKLLAPTNVKCQKAVIAIGGNDAWYGTSKEIFMANLREAIALVKKTGSQQIFLIPAFYSTAAAGSDPTIAPPQPRVEEINSLINQVAATEKVSVESEGIQPLYEKNVLKQNLTRDGNHLNAEGINIYRQALLKILGTGKAVRNS